VVNSQTPTLANPVSFQWVADYGGPRFPQQFPVPMNSESLPREFSLLSVMRRYGLNTCRPIATAALLVFLATGLAACGKGFRDLVIVDASGAHYHAFLEGGGVPPDYEVLAPGRIILFRTATPIVIGGKTRTGLPGHLYRINTNRELDPAGEFDIKLSDSALLQKYAQ
jgi:hypothetical protein